MPGTRDEMMGRSRVLGRPLPRSNLRYHVAADPCS